MIDAGFLNVAAHLPAWAREEPERLAVIFPAGRDAGGRRRYVHWTTRQLDAESDALAHGLVGAGIVRGMRTVLMVQPSLEFFAYTFALFKVGAVPVLVDPGMGAANLGTCLSEAEPEAFIGIFKAHLARRLLGWAGRTVKHCVMVGSMPWLGGVRHARLRANGLARGPYPVAEVGSDETAGILFTSGSTGVPKGAVYTHSIFAAQVDALRRTYAIQPGEVDLCTFPLFALFAPALGMTAVIPDMDATRPGQVHAPNLFEAIADWKVTNLFGSPALLRRIVEHPEAPPLHSLHRANSAGAPVPADVLEKLRKLLRPGVQAYTPYGATEALPVCNIGSDEILGETRTRTQQGAGVCIGRPVEGLIVRVIRISDEPIAAWSEELLVPEGVIGEIVVQGPVVTRSYYRRPDQTALAKIDGGRWHRMGDVGYFDGQGRLWFCGRKSHRVLTREGTLFTIPCEAIFNQHPEVFRTALVGIGPPPEAMPVICVELKKGVRADPARLDRELRALGQAHELTRSITQFLIHPAFPVDIRHNSKIFREKLAVWASHQFSRLRTA